MRCFGYLDQVTQVLEKRTGTGERSRAKAAWLNGVCRVGDLAELTGASETAIRKWVVEFLSEEEAKIKAIRQSEFGVTPPALRMHEKAIEILENEVKALEGLLEESRDDAAEYKKRLDSFLFAQRRLSELTGVESLVVGHRTRVVCEAKREGLEKEPEPTPPRASNLVPSGPVVPL